jgi:hypothetical protein
MIRRAGRIATEEIPGFCSEIVSVTFCMKMRPFSCSFGFPSFVTSDRVDILFLGLLTLISLQQRRIISKR